MGRSNIAQARAYAHRHSPSPTLSLTHTIRSHILTLSMPFTATSDALIHAKTWEGGV